MKRHIAVRCAAALVLAALLGVGAAQAKDSAGTVRVDRLAGAVEVLEPDAAPDQWVDAELGQQLTAGWSLRTGSQSKAQLVFPHDNVIILKEKSVLTISEVFKSGAAHVKSTDGGLLVQLKHKLDPGAEFTLDAPTAQAIVRGTEYGVQIDDTGKTDANGDPVKEAKFYGYEGTVEVKNDHGTQMLQKGNELLTELDKVPGLPVASAAEALSFFNDLTSDKLFKAAEERAKNEVKKKADKALDHAKKKIKFP